jgi:hypothetical protein
MQSSWIETHAKNLVEKHRLEKTQIHRKVFETILLQRQREYYDKQINQIRRRLLQEKRVNVINVLIKHVVLHLKIVNVLKKK